MTRLNINYLAKGLFHINEKILNWDLSLVEGKGLIHKTSGSDRYAHIELFIQKSDNDYSSEVIWDMTDNLIPYNLGHRPFVENTLEFFTNYVAGIKGETIFLKFQITNISFHTVDTSPIHFVEATMRALINCFDDTLFPFFNVDLVKRISEESLDYLRTNKEWFLKNEIIESLRNHEISDILSKIFNRKNIDIRMLNGRLFNNYISECFQNRKVLLQNSELLLLKKNNAVNENEDITDIGKAHVAKILDDEYDLKYHFNISFEDFQ